MRIVVGFPTSRIIAEYLAGEYPQVELVTMVSGPMLDEHIQHMSVGDVFVAELHEMIPLEGCGDDFQDAADYITRINSMLPEGAHAYLIDLVCYHTDGRVLRAVIESQGRVYLQAGPLTAHELVPQLEKWHKEGATEYAPQPGA